MIQGKLEACKTGVILPCGFNLGSPESGMPLLFSFDKKLHYDLQMLSSSLEWARPFGGWNGGEEEDLEEEKGFGEYRFLFVKRISVNSPQSSWG